MEKSAGIAHVLVKSCGTGILIIVELQDFSSEILVGQPVKSTAVPVEVHSLKPVIFKLVSNESEG
jgi:hypothetical protein